MNQQRKVVLVFVKFYLPGYKSGGPVRTISNMVHTLGDEFEFKVITSDRDALEYEPYKDVEINKWLKVGKAQVFYASESKRTLLGIQKIINETPCDVLYLNSFFDLKFSIIPLILRRLGVLPKTPVVLAPRGEFSMGALRIRNRKKQLFILLSKIFSLHKNVTWHASSDHERLDIANAIGSSANENIYIAPNLPQTTDFALKYDSVSLVKSEPLRIVFLSRISSKKNLVYALHIIMKVSHAIVFDIYGAVDDEKHWAKCKELIGRLPSNIKVTFHGVVTHDKVSGILGSYDLFFLPTLGENYGHAIAESLSVGTPVLISDQTPWRNLESEGAGWDFSLENESDFVEVIEKLTRMENEDYVRLRRSSVEFAERMLKDPLVVKSNRLLLSEAALKVTS